ncbi:Rieske 2Fe-2S domain-containing protein [Mucilaginibacter arboris]|uniref:Rieske 2Fe-2S domain-containing protein n=1 Tax=Mucilaginibacter arboris TaxID=2682090 RepID=A0A7K1SX19_9SPHI|nr:Rieske 2Fe-2S domain-containing protein [Mucilaginibacter arboris]MVN21852.1 Rieske 2Fe-2S domain-containing protein [Mucilaginibacter arboris]
MNSEDVMDTIAKQEWLKAVGKKLQPTVIKAFEAGGETGQKIKNFLHGTWLGHPLHPIITDVPVGSWTAAVVLDAMELSGQKKYAAGADAAIAIGLAGAVGAAVSGITDWSGTTQKRSQIGLMHGILNVAATALYTTSYIMRKNKGPRKTAIGLALLGYGITSAAAYLGGHLVYVEQTGVDHTATAAKYPKEFVAVLPENELADNSMKRVQAGEIPVLLAKKNGEIFAIAHTCSHLGGPLSEGDLLDDNCVRCPWHGSVFSLEDGSVVDGPATAPQPKFEVRTNNGQIEVRLIKNDKP